MIYDFLLNLIGRTKKVVDTLLTKLCKRRAEKDCMEEVLKKKLCERSVEKKSFVKVVLKKSFVA